MSRRDGVGVVPEGWRPRFQWLNPTAEWPHPPSVRIMTQPVSLEETPGQVWREKISELRVIWQKQKLGAGWPIRQGECLGQKGSGHSTESISHPRLVSCQFTVS